MKWLSKRFNRCLRCRFYFPWFIVPVRMCMLKNKRVNTSNPFSGAFCTRFDERRSEADEQEQ